MSEIIREFSGHAYQWNTWGFRDPDKSGKRRDMFCFTPHSFTFAETVHLTRDLDGQTVFASTTDGTLDLATDDAGLLVTARLVDNELNRELCQLIDAGKIRGWSFHAHHPFAPRTIRKDGEFRRTEIHRSEVQEVTLVISTRKMPRMRIGRTAPIFRETSCV